MDTVKVVKPIIWNGREVPAGTVLVVGTHITDEQKKVLLGIGEEVISGDAVVLEAPSAEDLEKTRAYIEDLEKRLEEAEKERDELKAGLAEREKALETLQGRYDELAGQIEAASAARS
jgi:predicted nuclease with TOPRIM domain